jgi:hypothetical protein
VQDLTNDTQPIEGVRLSASFLLAAAFVYLSTLLALLATFSLAAVFAHWSGIAVLAGLCVVQAVVFSIGLWRVTTGRLARVRILLVACLTLAILGTLAGGIFALNEASTLLNYGFNTYYQANHSDPRWVILGRESEGRVFACAAFEMAAAVTLPFCIRRARLLMQVTNPNLPDVWKLSDTVIRPEERPDH